MRTPDDQEAGAYSNVLAIWHTPHEFTLDFAVTLPPMQDAQGNVTVPARIVARVKIPPTVAFDVVRTLNTNLTKYEAKYGPIQKPGGDPPMYIPDDLRLIDPDAPGDQDDD
ncbi:MAG: DUF3467 domain-containing protein [Acidimicrobiia bacterium]